MISSEDESTSAIIQGLTKSLYINSIQSTTTTHEVFIDDYIEDPHKYRQLISLLINAPESDNVHLYINSGGGNLDTACAIINAVAVSNAEVTAFLMGACHSAASIITMYCHNVHIFDSAYMMVHTASFGSSGNTSNVKSHTDFTVKQVEKLLDDCYTGFLTADELKTVKNGVEIWFDAEEMKPRFKNRFAALQKMDEDRVKAETAATLAADAPKPKRTKKVKANETVIPVEVPK